MLRMDSSPGFSGAGEREVLAAGLGPWSMGVILRAGGAGRQS